MEELRSGNYVLDEISAEKRAIMYIQVQTRSPKLVSGNYVLDEISRNPKVVSGHHRNPKVVSGNNKPETQNW